jgi:hypothetical protein
MQGPEFKLRPPPKKLKKNVKKMYFFPLKTRVLLTSVIRAMVKESININFVLKI